MTSKQRSEIKYLNVPMWAVDLFDIKLLEGNLYGLLLGYGLSVWDYDYLARLLHMTKPTIISMIKVLEDKGMIYKHHVTFGSRKRAILIPLYEEDGRISDEEINSRIDRGISILNNYYSKHSF